MARSNHFQSQDKILAEKKFGIRIPKTVKEALEVDKATGTNFWGIVIQN